MLAHILPFVAHYGYAGLFAALVLGIAGLPIPDETVMVFCGYLVYRGTLNGPAAYATGVAGSICGISTSYLIGRTAGAALIERWGHYLGITPGRIARVQDWFHHRGEWVLTFGYFILGVRHVTALAAGMSRLDYRTFALFAYSGAVIWTASFLTLGYLVGEKWESAVSLAHRYSLASACIAVAAVLIWFLWRRSKRPRGGRERA